MGIVGGTWTYSGDPGASDLDAVRFLVQDTDAANQLLGDEELLWLLAENPNVYKAAAEACRRLATQRPYDSVSTTVGGLSESESGTGRWYVELADRLERQATQHGAVAVPLAGGIDATRKAVVAADQALTPPRFTSGQFDRPGAED